MSTYFVFDALFLSHFVNQGLLLPLPEKQIVDRADILPFALDACTVQGEVYALPEFLCSDFLYTRKDDSALSDVSSVAELQTCWATTATRRSPQAARGFSWT